VKKRFIFLFILFISISLSVLSQVEIKKSNKVVVFNGKEYYIHIVEKGHTLYSLARVYEIPMNEIIFENPSAKDRLSIGQELKIPVNSRDIAVVESLRNDNDEFFYHVVKSGESMKAIATVYLISKQDLERSNPELHDPLKKGQYVKIPVGAKKIAPVIDQPVQSYERKQDVHNVANPKSENLGEHIIKAGENLYRIALKYKISIDEIKDVNPGLNEESLNIGQRIKIPLKKKESDFIIHKVKRRSKLTRIARDYNIDIQILRKYNPNIKDKLKSGDIVKIPLNEEVEVKSDVFPIDEGVKVEELLNVNNRVLNKDSLQCMNYVGNVLDTFKVALMIPLYLEEVDSLKFTEDTNIEEFLEKRPFRFLQFYYGAMMAVDSLEAMGMNIKLSIFDVDNSIGKTIQTLQNSSLQEQDLIIGPFFPDSFKYASHFAKIFEIPIINPLTNRSEILEDNPFVYKCQSNPNFQRNQLRNLVATYFSDSKIFIVKHKKTLKEIDFPLYYSEIQNLIDTGYYIPNDDIFDLIIEKSLLDTTTVHISNEFVATYDEYTNSTLEYDTLIVEDKLLSFITIEGTQILTDSIEFNLYDSTYIKNSIVPFYYATDSIYGFEKEASIYRENVVLVLTDDNVFALDLMTKLNIERDTFPTTVIGLPNWQEFENMDNEILSNLKVHFLSSGFVNYQDRNTNSFIREFRKRHLSEPLDYAFKGFDISWYFLNALNNFGKNFDYCLPYYKQSYIQSRMDFERSKEGDGFENRFWTVLKNDSYHLKEIDIFPIELPVIERLDPL